MLLRLRERKCGFENGRFSNSRMSILPGAKIYVPAYELEREWIFVCFLMKS